MTTIDYFERYNSLRQRLKTEELTDQQEFNLCFLLDLLWPKLTDEQKLQMKDCGQMNPLNA